jgi:DegV family protein with EDD domain
MSIENNVSVVTDSGCSVRPDITSKEGDISIAPLDVKFFENGQWVSYEDATKLSIVDFYQKMRTYPQLPQTSGAIPGKLLRIYDSLAKENHPIISIHISSRVSGACDSAHTASEMVLGDHPHLSLKIVDSRQVSTGVWFLAQQAAVLAGQGYPLEDINQITLETIPKIDTFTSLSTFENIVKGGRLPSAANYLTSTLKLRPIAGIVDGEIRPQGIVRTDGHVQEKLVKRVENVKGDIVRLAVIHTNFLEGATLLKQNLAKVYSGDIEIFEAGPTIAVHTGERGLGISLQKA